MNFKDLFNRIVILLSSPREAWKKIVGEEDGYLLGAFVYPMIAICGLAVFIGMLFGNGVEDFNFQYVMTECCSIFISLFGGFFFASFLIDQFGIRFMGREEGDRGRCQKLVGYSMVVVFVLEIFNGLFPSFLILSWILQFYTIYIVWEGSKLLMGVVEEKLLSYTLVCSAIILVSPAMISYLFDKLSQVLN